jgi:hypothetical protein
MRGIGANSARLHEFTPNSAYLWDLGVALE